MARAAQKIDESASTIQGLRTRLQGHKASVLGGWEGNAAQAFGRVFDAFDQDFAKVLQALEGIHEKLVQTKIKYESAEEQQTDAANAISSLLNH